MGFSLRRHYPEQVNGYDLSLPMESTPEIQVLKRTLQGKNKNKIHFLTN